MASWVLLCFLLCSKDVSKGKLSADDNGVDLLPGEPPALHPHLPRRGALRGRELDGDLRLLALDHPDLLRARTLTLRKISDARNANEKTG